MSHLIGLTNGFHQSQNQFSTTHEVLCEGGDHIFTTLHQLLGVRCIAKRLHILITGIQKEEEEEDDEANNKKEQAIRTYSGGIYRASTETQTMFASITCH